MKIFGLDTIGLSNNLNYLRNLSIERLIEESISSGETKMAQNGAVMVDTGIFTGRSPKDKYFVKEKSSRDKIWWGDVNRPIEKHIFEELFNQSLEYYNSDKKSKTFIFDGYGGDCETNRLPIRVLARKAWQAHFCHNMFVRPKTEELDNFKPEFTIINASDIANENFKKHGLNSSTFIIFSLDKKVAIIGGTEYAGEMKKGIFSVLHYLLPQKNILSMHCSCNVDESGQNVALFFGLSGTGKTTLSTDYTRPLVGDDEHGWSDNGIFNFEGGCYAKAIRLNKVEEPDIFSAIRHGALLENVVHDENNIIDFNDGSKTENTRVSYPITHIKNSLAASGKRSSVGHPKTIIFLTCDAYGVLPPVSKLSLEQAMYHFITGYTAKVAGTERGVTEPQATFSPCFGGPFLTLHPLVYAQLLKEKITKYNSKVYLVNTGWVGGSPSHGAKRISIKNTRNIISNILSGAIEKNEFQIEDTLNFSIPTHIDGVDKNILEPINMWNDRKEYLKVAKKLSAMFKENFKQYGQEVEHLEKFGPKKIKENL
ncbi:MAG: phosphoenolpyruvate carboxykinase (ATP) [Candidatus Marinimicrobia bacterium]|nr:phosphoenolpyruvate carboxykinase (ATP) [Candidatus Neomarinimicrobiota bacterium]